MSAKKPDSERIRDLPPHKRGFPTIRVKEPTKQRLRTWAREKGHRSDDKALNALMDEVGVPPLQADVKED